MKVEMEQVKDHLESLRDECFFHLNIASEYSYNYTIADDDYSQEYAANKAIYALDKYKRALGAIKLRGEKNNEVEFFRWSIYQVFDNSRDDFLDKYRVFCDDYFSDIRYDALIKSVKDETVMFLEYKSDGARKFLDEEYDTTNKVCDLIAMRDQIGLLARTDGTFLTYTMSSENKETPSFDWYGYLELLEASIDRVFNKYKYLWSVFAEDIRNLRDSMLVPAEEKERWWSLVPEITPATIMKEMRMRSDTVSVLSDVVRNNDTEGLFDKWEDQIEKTVGSIIKSHPGHAKRIQNLISEIPNAPQFAHWGQAGFIPPDSSDTETFARVSSILTDVIDDLIRIIEESEKIDDETRNRRLAVAYMARGKPEKAREILAED